MDQQSATYQVLSEAREKLASRRARIQVLVDEAAEIDRGIKALEKALGHKPQRQLPARTGQAGGDSPRARFTQKIITHVEDGPRSVRSIADHFGSNLAFVESVVTQAHNRGQLHFDHETGEVRAA